ncbi:MAG: hypothetical protein ACI9D8_001436, partial [Reinekea sp.]
RCWAPISFNAANLPITPAPTMATFIMPYPSYTLNHLRADCITGEPSV